MAMLKRTISIVRTGGGLSYRSLSSGNHVDTLRMVKALEAINVPSTQAEALTGAITGGLESVMEKVKADIAKSEEYQSTRVAEEVRKLRADIDKMRADIATLQAEKRCDHHIQLVHKVEQGFNELKDEFEETKYEVLKYAIGTLVAVSAAEAVMIYLMIVDT
ncbi:Coiled-coil domain-containing protein 90-like [Arabidopsis thaliana x Arabidopsis arenosa]|uniref:Coiled-coil domain-containing protein 90-like n=1 Tax=Arabidopsis thaliana x Arabidopsis arenosa TaxID=1240361 RepID=A0A8T2A6N0_9BRAS|nr:Coiled-coil domain-containing protein 90-like [Arabidopsis thaliana x Arabidopsis arenosa]